MRRQVFAVALLATPVLSQANAVVGLDIGMYEVTDIGYTGRRGAAYPNGEAGFMVGHSWCNGGGVNLPWQSVANGVMVDLYPRIAFLLVRESGGRMVQVSGQSFCKHSPTAYNFSSGPCAPCNVGSGSFFFVGCSDTYGSGINSSQYSLGPTTEIDPWLGTWNPQGSYFDHGDPAVTGPAAVDSVRSLTFQQVQAFDQVKNRMVVRESELLNGAAYFGQVQAVVQGEPLSARGNNLMNREVTIAGGSGGWSANAIGNSQLGSVLTRWQGSTYAEGGNGNDDGRFAVAVKVTGPVAGMWHYEYAIHNIDNNRGGASFRLPLATGGVVQNAGFRDIDDNPLNDWTVAQTANEIVFSAAANNALEWNTLYNVWFDCSIAPGAGIANIDQALIGPGALDVQVDTQAPSGLSFASKEILGAACGTCQGSFYELFAVSAAFDLAGRSMTMSLSGGAYDVVENSIAFVPAAGTNLAMSLNTQVTVTLPFSLPYPGGSTTQLHVCSSGYVQPGASNPVQLAPLVGAFLQGAPRWAAAWAVYAPSAASGNNVYYDANASRAIVTWSNVSFVGGTGANTFQMQFFPNGDVNVVWQYIAPAGFSVMTGWSPGGGHSDPGNRDLSATLSVPLSLCASPFDGLALDTDSNPRIGTTLQWQLDGIPPQTAFGILLRSLDQAFPAVNLAPIGMPGCYSHVVSPVTVVFTSPGNSYQLSESIPNGTWLVGVNLIGQAVTYNPTLTPLGLVASNGVKLNVGL